MVEKKMRRPPVPDAEASEPDEGAYEDTWYRTMKVRADRRSSDEAAKPEHEGSGQDRK